MSKLILCLWPFATLVLLGITLFFNYYAASGVLTDMDVGDVSDKYHLIITPAGWTFGIWAIIYTWQFLWISLCILLSLCYDMPSLLFTRKFYIAYNVANMCNAMWIIVWVNQLIFWAMVWLLGITACLCVAAWFAHRFMLIDLHSVEVETDYGGVTDDEEAWHTQRHIYLLRSKCLRAFVYLLVLNGVPFYATWCVVASHLNVGIVLVHLLGMDNEAACLLMLSVLSCVILGYWYLDFFKFRSYLRYTYSPYIVLIVAFCGVLSADPVSSEHSTSVFALVLLATALVGTVAKVASGLMMRAVSSSRARTDGREALTSI